MIHITCRLTAKNRDQLQKPTLGNRVWATFTFTSSDVSGYVGPTGAQSRALLLETLVRRRLWMHLPLCL